MSSEKTDQGSPQLITCSICNHNCRLIENQTGICGVRRRKGTKVESLIYGRVVAENVDPIEKKPVFHVLPGSLSYSIATPGCNFRCLHCQNSSISQVDGAGDLSKAGVYRAPETIVSRAESLGCRSISYTYVEPTVFFEFALDCCRIADQRGIKNIFVSNGYMSTSTLIQLAPVVHAINIDLKSFRDSFYKKVCGARLEPVLNNIKHFVSLGVWVEVTTLIIPGLNDTEKELHDIAEFLCGVDENIPWHVSGFYPSYKMTSTKPTPPATLARAFEIGKSSGLQHVYTGNRPGSGGENSYCASCGMELIVRHGFRVRANKLVAGCCPNCQSNLPGVWS
ncbi:MAG: AmmeMemoRadiSam system radical SAM enzyme [Desulfobulbaceae bacterium]|nr:AmmeMemoRadiSam system radical SAM enzyme [Desulfobulbaceae bacterium]